MTAVLVWFYLMGGVAFGPFADETSCQAMRTYHVEQWKQPAFPCEQAWEARGRVEITQEDNHDA